MRPSKTRAFDDTSSSSSSSCIESDGSDDSSGELSDQEGRVRRSRPQQEQDAQRLQRLRRIFLSKPTAPERKTRRGTSQRRYRPRERERDSSASDGSLYSSSSSETEATTARQSTAPSLTLSVDEHIQVLCAHVKRMAHRHDSTVHQVYEMLQQGIEELKCLKAQEERTLQSQVRVIEESYALRLDLFEQQYRAKVAEIKEEKRRAIQQQREKCEDAILSTARRLHEQTQRALLSELNGGVDQTPIERVAEPIERPSLSTRREHHDADVDHATAPRVSPVSRQKAKLRAMEAKLSAFSEDAVRRVTREIETQRRRHHERHDPSARVHPTPPLVPSSSFRDGDENDDETSVRPTPLSPLRKRPSYWKKGISREAPDDRQRVDKEAEQEDSTRRLNRRFLRADEERELRALRNSIGLAKDWMERHGA